MSDQLRLSDAERELAAADLGEHFAQGRITVDEHAERLDRIWASKTRGEIPPIFADLPSAYAAPAPRGAASGPSPYRSRSRGRGRGFPPPIFLVLAILFVVSAVTHFPVFLIGLIVWFGLIRHWGFHGCRTRWH